MMEYVIKPENRFSFNWREIWQHRELFYFFTWRDIKIKYKQTVIGLLWVVLQPMMMMLIFTFFFGGTLNISSQDIPYPVFVFSGLLIWSIFSNGLSAASNSMVNNSLIIKKIYFPRLIIPVSALLVALFDFLIAFTLFLPMLVYFRQAVTLAVFWCWPLALIVSIAATLGPGCWFAALNVKYRDFRYVVPFLLQVLFFVAPVIYPLSMLKYQALRYLLAVSPVYAPLTLFRYPITSDLGDATLLVISISSALVFLFIGVYYFRKTEDFFADLA